MYHNYLYLFLIFLLCFGHFQCGKGEVNVFSPKVYFSIRCKMKPLGNQHFKEHFFSLCNRAIKHPSSKLRVFDMLYLVFHNVLREGSAPMTTLMFYGKELS
jgi:hypothetical protein